MGIDCNKQELKTLTKQWKLKLTTMSKKLKY